jgi:diguanylate cyclase (GGDEF)-like protein
MAASSESWSTQQLVEFVALLSACTEEQHAVQVAVERAAEALEAEVCALVRGGSIAASIGFPDGIPPELELALAFGAGSQRMELPGLGPAWTIAAALEDEPGAGLLVARLGDAAFAQEEADLLRGIARVLTLTLRMVSMLSDERELRRRSEQAVLDRERAERELAHQELHDSLTQLPNRTLLRDRTARALERAGASGSPVAALVVDLDNFKLVNDALGHSRGDRLLTTLAHRLATALRLEDERAGEHTLARVGGDEFVVLREDLEDEHEAITTAESIRQALRAPFALDGEEIRVTASIGIAVSSGRDRSTERDADDLLRDADDLLRDADVAMHRAKERGRDRYEVFDQEMRARLLGRIALEAELRGAIERRELTLRYQPVVSVDDTALVGVEALVRWQHPTRGLLGPAEFVPVAEESDLIVTIGEWVIDEACAQLLRWRESGSQAADVRMSVNVSARQLTPQLVDVVADALRRSGISPALLALEITESLLIEQAGTSSEILEQLRQLGVAIVLDDFGTGYSSLGYLKSFPLDQLKLDRTFVSQLGDDPRSAKIVSATIEMARALGMTVVAEGVETADQLHVLRRLGCDYAQGYHFAEPEHPATIVRRAQEAAERDRRRADAAALKLAAAASEPAAARPDPAGPRAPLTPDAARRQAEIGRLAGFLFCTAAALSIPVAVMLGDPSNPWVAAGMSLLGLCSGAVCFRIRWEHASPRAFHVLAVIANAETALAVSRAPAHVSVYQWYYLLIAAAAAYTFERRRDLAAHLALIAGAMALPLAYAPDPTSVAVPRALISIGAVAVAVVIVARLRERLEGRQAELRELAERDPLTGLGNYRVLHERLEYELVRHQRTERRLAILLIDLDRFKQVNERFGHGAGDDVLRRVARALVSAVRAQDTVARQGGDEFAVLAPETDGEGATMLAARIRERVGHEQFAGQQVGATIGVAVFPDDGDSSQHLLADADSRLIARKERARAAATVAPSPAPSPAVLPAEPTPAA